MSNDIIKFLSEFHDKVNPPKAILASFIAPMPKLENPQLSLKYIPISLVGSLYKIIAKLLVNRMKTVMGKLVSKSQTTFIPGRQMQDEIVVLNEIVDFSRRKRKKCMLLKVDFEKAYDNVNWAFLLYILNIFGFRGRWINWMKSCVSLEMLSILINGSPTSDFKMDRGLLQGDLLSLILFTLVVEELAMLVSRAVKLGILKGFSLSAGLEFELL